MYGAVCDGVVFTEKKNGNDVWQKKRTELSTKREKDWR